MAACETEEEGEGKEGEKTEGERKTENEKETVISEQVKEVKKTVQDLKKEVSSPHIIEQDLGVLPHHHLLLLSPADPCSNGPVVWGLSPATGSHGES